jgi:hypothetical protein
MTARVDFKPRSRDLQSGEVLPNECEPALTETVGSDQDNRKGSMVSPSAYGSTQSNE